MVDLGPLLRPFDDSAPAGADLRAGTLDPQLRAVQDAVRDARSAERNGDKSDWQAVERLATGIIVQRSKDITVASNLIEAWARRIGLAGLASGAALLAGLLERFPDSIHYRPYADRPNLNRPDAAVALVAELVGPQGRLLPVARTMVLFFLPDGTEFTFEGCTQSRAWSARPQAERDAALKGLSEATRSERQKLPAARPWEKVVLEARGGGAARLVQLRQDATTARTAWEAFNALLAERAAGAQAAMATLLNLLTEVERIAIELSPLPDPATADGADVVIQEEPQAEPAPASSARGGGHAGIRNREDALQALLEIAQFFRRTEPASPFAYALTTLVRRARMSWPELAAEVLPDKGPREGMFQRLGIQPEDLAQ